MLYNIIIIHIHRHLLTYTDVTHPSTPAGVSGMYRGLTANLVTSAPISAIYTSTYEAVKEALLPHMPPVRPLSLNQRGMSRMQSRPTSGNRWLTCLIDPSHLISGMDSCRSLPGGRRCQHVHLARVHTKRGGEAATPAESAILEQLVGPTPRIPLHQGSESCSILFGSLEFYIPPHPTGSRSALTGMVRSEGIASLYNGLGAVLCRNVPQSVLKVNRPPIQAHPLYRHTFIQVTHATHKEFSAPLMGWGYGGMGGWGGCMGQFLTYEAMKAWALKDKAPSQHLPPGTQVSR